ncbi:MAG: 4Fe-4S dicluster domain-containing protein [Raoultibacter sp.]
MTQHAFFFDGSRCTGCKTCEFACKDYYDLNKDTQYRKVYECTGGETIKDSKGSLSTTCFSYYVSLACNHCTDPVCTKVCPTGAMHKNEETGLVSVDATKCIGCGYCHMACPYNVPKVDREKGHSVKCDGCADRVAAGEQPICVRACPARALEFGTVDVIAKLGAVADIAPLPASSFTHPNLYIKPSKDALPSGSADGKVVNPLEVQ